MTATYYAINGLRVSNGNAKIGSNTLIINMGSAHDCPSRKLGLCRIPDGKCYAKKPERIYPGCLPYRNAQASYWLNTSPQQICSDFDTLFSRHKCLKKRVKYLRFNESGDFYGQDCVDKLSFIATYIKKRFNIVTYGYTARADLTFEGVNFNVKGSSHNKGNGECIARKIKKGVKQYKENSKTYFVCPGNCRNCKLCKVTKFNIVIQLH